MFTLATHISATCATVTSVYLYHLGQRFSCVNCATLFLCDTIAMFSCVTLARNFQYCVKLTVQLLFYMLSKYPMITLLLEDCSVFDFPPINLYVCPLDHSRTNLYRHMKIVPDIHQYILGKRIFVFDI